MKRSSARSATAALTLVAATLGLTGCTPEGLMVFGHMAQSEDVPPDAARSILPATEADDFRLLGTVDTATYYATVLAGSELPWCLVWIDLDGAASAACAAEPKVVTYTSAGIVSLSNDAPDELHDWHEVETSFWIAPLN